MTIQEFGIDLIFAKYWSEETGAYCVKKNDLPIEYLLERYKLRFPDLLFSYRTSPVKIYVEGEGYEVSSIIFAIKKEDGIFVSEVQVLYEG